MANGEHEQVYLDKKNQDGNAPDQENLGNVPDWFSTPNTLQTDKTVIIKNSFIQDDVNTILLKGQKVKVKSIQQQDSANYQIALTDFIISIQDVGVSRTLFLPYPSMAGLGKRYIIKDASGSALTTTITISPNGASDGAIRIDGDTTNIINSNFGVKRFFTDGGSNWFTD